MRDIFKFICLIIGTFVGAGFASGNEIYLFFLKYGFVGILGIFLSCVFLGINIFLVIFVSKRNCLVCYDEFLNFIFVNKYIKNIFLYFMNIFFAVSFGIMVSGLSAFLEQEFGLLKSFNYVCILFFSYFILIKKTTGIIKINKIVIPFIIFFVIFIFCNKIKSLNFDYFFYIENTNKKLNFVIQSLVYANYNFLTMIPIIIGAIDLCKNRNSAKLISIFSSIIIFVLSVIVFCILTYSDISLQNLEMPTLYIVGKYGVFYKNIFRMITVSAIVTTLISCGYSFLQKYENDDILYKKKIAILIFVALLFSVFKFSELINLLYPIFGVLAVIQNCFLIKKILKKDFRRKNTSMFK